MLSAPLLPTIQTARLQLRSLQPADRAPLFAIYSDGDVMQFAADPPFPDLAMVDLMLASVARLQADGLAYEWGIVQLDSGALIGTCGLHSFADTTTAEVGCLLARAYWGRGLMYEALSALFRTATTDFGLRILLADIDAGNIRSRRLFRRLGFTPIGGTYYRRQLD